MMPPDEWAEVFLLGERAISGIFTEWDDDAERTESGMIIRKVSLLIGDENESLAKGHPFKIHRISNGRSYLIKELRRTGIGLLELRLQRLEEGEIGDIGDIGDIGAGRF